MDLTVPPSEEARQAISSLKGYAHQLYLTLGQWSRLAQGETLLLEVAEDYAVAAKSALKMVQVKNSDLPVTLRTKGALKAIRSLWEFQASNPEREVTLVFLTTATIRPERGSKLPNRMAGIEYWRRAAQGEDVEPLRRLLLTLSLPGKMLDFIKASDDESLRNHLLRRMQWLCGTCDLEEVRSQLQDELVCLAAGRQLLAADGEAALPILLHDVLVAIVEGERKLTRADFERAFGWATSVPVSRTLMRERIRPGGLALPMRMGPTPTASFIARELLTEAARKNLIRHGRLALIGIGGSGKTELASVLARPGNDPPFPRRRGVGIDRARQPAGGAPPGLDHCRWASAASDRR